jgi:hypothetical protein
VPGTLVASSDKCFMFLHEKHVRNVGFMSFHSFVHSNIWSGNTVSHGKVLESKFYSSVEYTYF